MATANLEKANLQHLAQMAQDYPNRSAAKNEIINMEAVLKLPKGTEHFISDVHGEYEAFSHILNNASGVVREKVDAALGESICEEERASLATLIYYPQEKITQVENSGAEMGEWYRTAIYRLVEVCHHVASKSTRKFVRQSLPKGYEYIIDELMQAHFEDENKSTYYEQLVQSMISTGQAAQYIGALAKLIKELAVYRLHIVGDVYDRGPRPDIIMDMLCTHHSADVQWGNHDVLWMGACAGSEICVATLLGVTVRYRNFELLEEGYGIDLSPLKAFAEKEYAGVDCKVFNPKLTAQEKIDVPKDEVERVARMYKAIMVIQFKLEGEVIARNPDFKMDGRILLPKVDYAKGTVEIGGADYALKDYNFPTVDPENPMELTAGERKVLTALCKSFAASRALNRHVQFLYEKGGIYKVENKVLMFHGALPMEQNGSFSAVTFGGKEYSGKALFDYSDDMARAAYFAEGGSAERQRGQDFIWYLWCGPKSPLFGRGAMATFERTLITDKNTHTERKDDYYRYTDSETVAVKILEEFGLDKEHSHIVNGHVPIKASKGENPIKAGGHIIMIDGGFSKAYQSTTGIAGYTMVYTSRGISIRSHEPFVSFKKAVRDNQDIHSTVNVFEHHRARLLIKDTDEGAQIARDIEKLYELIDAYENGYLPESGEQFQGVLR